MVVAMSDPGPEAAVRLLQALAKLPARPGLVFRGRPEGVARLEGTVVTDGLVATSRDIRIATENFTIGGVYAIATRTARDVAPLSADPAAAEQVLLPGAALTPLVTGRVPPGIEVELLEELALDGAAAEPLPWSSLDALGQDVAERVAAAFAAEAVEIRTPGKSVGTLA